MRSRFFCPLSSLTVSSTFSRLVGTFKAGKDQAGEKGEEWGPNFEGFCYPFHGIIPLSAFIKRVFGSQKPAGGLISMQKLKWLRDEDLNLG